MTQCTRFLQSVACAWLAAYMFACDDASETRPHTTHDSMATMADASLEPASPTDSDAGETTVGHAAAGSACATLERTYADLVTDNGSCDADADCHLVFPGGCMLLGCAEAVGSMDVADEIQALASKYEALACGCSATSTCTPCICAGPTQAVCEAGRCRNVVDP